jgi:N-acyl homoserine lactone hydrolase
MTSTPPVTTSGPHVETLLEGNGFDTDQGGIAFCAVTLIQGTDAAGKVRRIVVDPGASGRMLALQDALAQRGLTGSDIDAVVLTHAHWDHMQNLDPFDRAVFHVHPNELNYIKNPHPGDFATPRWTKAVIDCYDVREVTEATEVIPGVTVIEAPGHSAGSIAVAVTTAEGVAVVTGDAIQSVSVARSGRNPLVFFDEEAAAHSITRLLKIADIIRPGHDRPFRLSGTGTAEYLYSFHLTLRGLSEQEVAGLTIAQPTPSLQSN